MDHVSKEIRSRIMAAVRSRGNTTTELPLAKLLWNAGIRGYRKHWPVAGRPDFAWPGRKVAVFVDGCFWHGCRCKYLPRTTLVQIRFVSMGNAT
jgi:DNA mismatch endonuclease (patch repair protein)